MTVRREALDLIEPPYFYPPRCDSCGHSWHGLECESTTGTTLAVTWAALRGHRCCCPSSCVEPPC